LKLDDFAFLALEANRGRSKQNIHPEVVAFLRGRGLDAASVEELGLASAADRLILQTALETNRIVLTHDSDFGFLAIATGQPILGIVFLRPGHVQADFTIRTLDAIFEAKIDVTPPFLVVAVRSRDKVRIRTRSL